MGVYNLTPMIKPVILFLLHLAATLLVTSAIRQRPDGQVFNSSHYKFNQNADCLSASHLNMSKCNWSAIVNNCSLN